MSRHQNIGKHLDIKGAKRSFENVAMLKYMRKAVTYNKFDSGGNKEEIEFRYCCYHLVQNILSSCLLSKNINIRLYRTIILPVVLYVFETWSPKLGEKKLRMFENRVLKRIFGPKRDEMVLGLRKLHNEELHNLHHSPSIIRMMK
jgi:hypothetical protein